MKKNLLLLGLSFCWLALALGCAAPGAPQPPSLRVPTAVDNLAATRKGNRVVLTWSPPTETTDHQAMRWPTVTRVCRVINQFPTNVCGEVVRRIPAAELVSVASQARRPLVAFEDVLPPSILGTTNEATYAVEVMNERGRSAGLSNQVRIPLVPTLPPPNDFRVTLDGDGPQLQWNSPAIPVPPAGVSYRLRAYRSPVGQNSNEKVAKGSTAFTIVSEEPYRAGVQEARDNNFEWEQSYDYKIATVTLLSQGERGSVEVEGDDSPVLRLLTHDIFPPATPTGLQAVFSSVGQKPFIDLTWAPNTERDLAGYIVFRRTPGREFAVVSSAPVKAPAWRDNDVKPGQQYFYTVVAIDARGNQSAQSAPAAELVPLEAE